MKEQEQRIAIAETCPELWYDKGYGWTDTGFLHHVRRGLLVDPLNDLNAMHEAEKILSAEQMCLYFWLLLEMTSYKGPVIDGLDGDNGGFELINMCAARRAEAFLKTLNLWKS